MPAMRDRNRKRRKVKVRIATKVAERRLPRKPAKASCRDCKGDLHGVPRELPSKMKKIPKTAKRPERPYGGNLCSRCMRKQIKIEARL